VAVVDLPTGDDEVVRTQGWLRVAGALACALVLATLASPALANGGTPLMLATAVHLVIGNALIGCLEGWGASLLLPGLRRARAMALLILANYASMGLGLVLIPRLRQVLGPLVLGDTPICRLPWLIGLILLATFAFTVLAEWPLLALAAWRRKTGLQFAWRQTLLAVLLVNALSYALLLVYYLPSAHMSLLTECHRSPRPDFIVAKDAVIYCRPSDATDELYRLRLDGSQPTRIGGSWEQRRRELGEQYKNIGNNGGGHAVDLRPPGKHDWRQVATGRWSGPLWAKNAATGERVEVWLEIPYFWWYPHSATVLPGDQVVFQVDRYTVLLDLNTRRLADVATGDGPLVVLEPLRSPG